MTKFRRYADGSVVYEDEFGEYDNGQPLYDDYAEHTEHELKIGPIPFIEVVRGRKPFEIRKNDRNFQVGDRLLLREYYQENEYYTGRSVVVDVICASVYAQQDGYVVLGTTVVDE